jgi:hypothetical protein
MYVNFVDSVSWWLQSQSFLGQVFLKKIELLGTLRIFNLNSRYISKKFELLMIFSHNISPCNWSRTFFFFYLIGVDLKVLWSFFVIWQFGLCLIKCSDAHYKKLCQILFSFFLFRNAHKIAGFVSWRWYLFEGNFLIYR